MILQQSNPTNMLFSNLNNCNELLLLKSEHVTVYFIKAPSQGRKRFIYLIINHIDSQRKSIAWLNYGSAMQRNLQCEIHLNNAGCFECATIKNVL